MWKSRGIPPKFSTKRRQNSPFIIEKSPLMHKFNIMWKTDKCGMLINVEKYYHIFMRKMEKNIITNMCLIYKDDMILVQLRTKSDWPGITFPGGHVEIYENFDESIKREVKEETGLELNSVKLCGIEEFKHLQGEDRHIILLYKSNDFKGEIKNQKNEDEIFWIKRKDLFKYQLSKDLDIMLKVIEDDSISELIYYKDGDEYKTIFK